MSYVDTEDVRSASTPVEINANKVPPLDPTNYAADEEFLSTVTGIKDAEQLKQHVLDVQAEAYAVYPYPCIRNFAISKTKINHYPAYQDLLKLGRERKGAKFLEAACCVGNDIRRSVLDGFPAEQIIGTDLNPGFWEVGHKLFKSTPATFPVKFLSGDIFAADFLDTKTANEGSMPKLSTLTNLTPLVGHVSAIHASSFFHLFDEERQLQLAHIFNALLSPEPGSIAFGAHGGLTEKGLRIGTLTSIAASRQMKMFCHSPESWKAMWEEVVGRGKAEINARLERAPDRKDCIWEGENKKRYWLVWSVKRL